MSTLIRVKVKPSSRATSLVQESDGTWMARLKAPPVDSKANEELIALVARHFKCRKSVVSIRSGGASRTKLLTIGED